MTTVAAGLAVAGIFLSKAHTVARLVGVYRRLKTTMSVSSSTDQRPRILKAS